MSNITAHPAAPLIPLHRRDPYSFRLCKALPLHPQNPAATDRDSLHLLVPRVETTGCRTRQHASRRHGQGPEDLHRGHGAIRLGCGNVRAACEEEMPSFEKMGNHEAVPRPKRRKVTCLRGPNKVIYEFKARAVTQDRHRIEVDIKPCQRTIGRDHLSTFSGLVQTSPTLLERLERKHTIFATEGGYNLPGLRRHVGADSARLICAIEWTPQPQQKTSAD